jgi:tetratricopeptide (TPR) repeat protein
MVDPTFAAVVRHFQSGQFQIAEAQCRSLISVNPRHSEANHLLGVILLQTGRTVEALERLQAAVASRPGNHEAQIVFGSALAMSGRFAEALHCFEKVVRAQPRNLQALYNLGLAHSWMGRHEEARKAFAKVLSCDPRHVMALMGQGSAYANLGDFEQASKCFERADALSPGSLDILEHLAKAQLSLKRLDEAGQTARRALAINPRAKARGVLAHIYYLEERFDEAERELRIILEHHPSDLESRNLLASLLRRVGALDEAYALFSELVKTYPPAHLSFGMCLKQMGRIEQAIEEVNIAQQLFPNQADIRHCRSQLLLQAGKLEEAWPDFPARFQTTVDPVQRLTLSIQLASIGEDLSNHTVLVWSEQSIGAQITFCSALADLIERAQEVEFISFPKLAPLFARSFPKLKLISSPSESHATRQMPTGDLFAFYRRKLDDFPGTPYLKPDPNRVKAIKDRLADVGPGLKVGIGWRSTLVNRERQQHFFGSLQELAPVLSVPGVTFINLQPRLLPDELAEARRTLSCRIEHFDDIDLFEDLDATAALTASLDLVISNGSANAFLAASLGCPVWMFFLSDAHWDRMGTDRIPWLASLVPVERLWDEDWQPALKRVAEALSASARQGRLVPPDALSERRGAQERLAMTYHGPKKCG